MFRHLAIERAIDDIADLILVELTTVTLLFDQRLERRFDEFTQRNNAFRHVKGCI